MLASDENVGDQKHGCPKEARTMKSQRSPKKQQNWQTRIEQWKDASGRVSQVASVILAIIRTLLEILQFGHTIGLW